MWVKTGAVILGAVALTTIGISASDYLQNADGSLVSMVSDATVGPCGEGAVLMRKEGYSLCVDMYEASPGDSCSVPAPASALDTQQNLTTDSCAPQSVEQAVPWRFVSLPEAQVLCARTGKRLPTNSEWFQFALGSTPDQCVISNSDVQPTGSCQSPVGVFDSIGNVWEWIDAEVVDGTLDDIQLPESGYVTLANTDGVALETSATPSTLYGEDYVRTRFDGVMGVIRGGFYGSESDAGLYALNAAVEFDIRATGIGFRCVRDL